MELCGDTAAQHGEFEKCNIWFLHRNVDKIPQYSGEELFSTWLSYGWFEGDAVVMCDVCETCTDKSDFMYYFVM